MSYSATQRERFLDLFYSYYPAEYKDLHYDGMTTQDLYSDLEYYCPGPFNHIKSLWDRGLTNGA